MEIYSPCCSEYWRRFKDIGGTADLNMLAANIHKWASDKGFWAEKRNFGEIIALAHSELSEALEAHRVVRSDPKHAAVALELADCIIRILDMCGAYGIPIGDVIADKMAYNCTRPQKHGKAY